MNTVLRLRVVNSRIIAIHFSRRRLSPGTLNYASYYSSYATDYITHTYTHAINAPRILRSIHETTLSLTPICLLDYIVVDYYFLSSNPRFISAFYTSRFHSGKDSSSARKSVCRQISDFTIHLYLMPLWGWFCLRFQAWFSSETIATMGIMKQIGHV